MKRTINLFLFIFDAIMVTVSCSITAVMIFIPDHVDQIQWVRPGIILAVTILGNFFYILLVTPNKRQERALLRRFWLFLQMRYGYKFVNELNDEVPEKFMDQS